MSVSKLSFLSLFPEIREIIYTLHLTILEEPPSHSDKKQNRIQPLRPDRNRVADRYYTESCNFYSDPATVYPRSLVLLLLNKEINQEVSSLIKFLTNHSKSELRYELDIEIAREREVYPTWLLLPIRFEDGFPIPEVHVTIRNTGQCVVSEWPYGNAGVYPMSWSLLALLERFLERGPGFIPLDYGHPAKVEERKTITNASEQPAGTSTTTPLNRKAKWKLGTKRLLSRFSEALRSKNRGPTITVAATPNASQDENYATASLSSTQEATSSDIPRIRIDKLIIDVSTELDPGQSYLPLDSEWRWPFREWIIDLDAVKYDEDGQLSTEYLRILEHPEPSDLHPGLFGKVVHPKDVARWLDYMLDYIFIKGMEPYNLAHLEYIQPRLGTLILRCEGEERKRGEMPSDERD
ncbi:hypothetical protein CPC08DRAFT_271465 [Agrocybe pediades]|nr:hypothetical protein CPC08DRAFT_271465 [Agrocybe pediades]